MTKQETIAKTRELIKETIELFKEFDEKVEKLAEQPNAFIFESDYISGFIDSLNEGRKILAQIK